jgi:hypothetical protein
MIMSNFFVHPEGHGSTSLTTDCEHEVRNYLDERKLMTHFVLNSFLAPFAFSAANPPNPNLLIVLPGSDRAVRERRPVHPAETVHGG